MELKFKNKKEAEQHAKKVLATLPAGWTPNIRRDHWFDELFYIVGFDNEDLHIKVEEDTDIFHIYHDLENYYASNKDILKGIAIIKEQILERAKELLALAEKL